MITKSRLISNIKQNWIQFFLIGLSIYELRIDLKLLFEFFTFSSLFYTISDNPLAITVLIAMPKFINLKNINK